MHPEYTNDDIIIEKPVPKYEHCAENIQGGNRSIDRVNQQNIWHLIQLKEREENVI